MTGERDASATLAFLEAAYAWERDDASWLRGLLAAAMKVWGRPHWACAYEYALSPPERFELGAVHFVGVRGTTRDQLIDRIVGNGPVLYRAYRNISMGYGGRLGGIDPKAANVLAEAQSMDFFGINGFDPGGTGCFVGMGTERNTLTAPEVVLFQRLAAHLASAYRCRVRLRALRGDPSDDSDAILDPDGRVLEARAAAAEPAARAAIGKAGRAIARLREQEPSSEPTAQWHPRIHTRWTLVDRSGRRGKRLLLARENQTQLPGLAALTEREQQVVASALTGKSAKEIAYELGISHSTARVLLARAYGRLGVRSREELYQLPEIRALRGDVPEV
jgi:DNA-binding CsgD family transcriptional regulator